jgi:hypothetical protein
MVKRKTSSSHTLQDKMENTTVTEESDMNETGLNEESETFVLGQLEVQSELPL